MDVALELHDPRGDRLPSLRDNSVRALLAFTFVLQLLVWSRLRGYSVADSVEFMERAQILVHAEPTVDEGVIRPFGFSSVLLPFFVVADWLGVQDARAVGFCIKLLQIGLALGLVFYSVRLAAQLSGRRAGIVAGLIVGTNPILLQYSTQPVSDIAAALFIALALESLLESGDFRRGLRGGLWLGAALLMAYKSLLVIFLILFIVYLRDARKRRPFALGITSGVMCGIAVQALLDRLMFGSFGVGLVNYLVQNGLSVIVSVCEKMHWRSLSEPVYHLRERLMGNDYSAPEDQTVRGLQQSWFYFVNLPQMLVWPVLALLAAGVWRTITKPSWQSWLLLLVLSASVAIMSNKGSKDFRLWLPLLPSVGALCALGWSYLFERSGRAATASRGRLVGPSVGGAATVLLVGSIVVLDGNCIRSMGLQQFGGYWSAIDWVNGRASETYPARAAQSLRCVVPETPPPRVKVAVDYNWAVYMRQSPLVDLHKLPWQLNFWNKYESEKKVADMEMLRELDVFIVHLPTLTENPDLFECVNEEFEVAAAFYDQATFAHGLGPVFVLVRRTGRSDALTFFDVHPGESCDSFSASRELSPSTDFIDAGDPAQARLVLLGYEYRELPGDHHGWITYHWCSPTGLTGNYDFIDRITSPDETNPWQNNHSPAYGLYPTSSWMPGEIVSEGYPVVASTEPFKPDARVRPVGGAYRRGDLIPARLWMAVVEYDAIDMHEGKLVERGHLSPALRGANVPVRGQTASASDRSEATSASDRSPAASASESESEVQFSADGLVRVGRFFLPVRSSARVPDDGRPIVQ
jgi:hypothetical protein